MRPGPHDTRVLDNRASACRNSGWTVGRALSSPALGSAEPTAGPRTSRGHTGARGTSVHAVGLRRGGGARVAVRPCAPHADGWVRTTLLRELRAGGKRCLLLGELNNGPLFQEPAHSARAHSPQWMKSLPFARRAPQGLPQRLDWDLL